MNNKVKWSKSLSKSIFSWLVVLSIVPILIISILAYTSMSKNILNSTMKELNNSSSLYVGFIKNWFKYRKTDLLSWSSTQNTINFMQSLNKTFKEENLELTKFLRTPKYAQTIKKRQNDFIQLANNYQYIYDLFLFDLQGNLLFTVAKESDLGTNFLTGKYSKTLFAKTIRQSIKDEKVHFSDFEFYKPSKNGVYGFLSAPIKDISGKLIGIYAIQIKPNDILNQFKKINNKNNGTIHYLIGSDLKLRSAIHNDSEILNKKVETTQTKVFEIEHIKGIQEEEVEGIFSYTGPENKEVIGNHYFINIFGIKWGLISEIQNEAIIKTTNLFKIEIFLVALASMIVTFIISIFVTRRITKPILKLSEASIDIANGKRNFVEIGETNEIGLLANSFNEMIEEVKEKELFLKNNTDQLKNTLHKLREQKLALDAHSIVAITDVKGTITYVNDKFTEISGYERDELIGQNHRILQTDEQDLAFWKEMYETISHGYIWDAEIKNKAKDGHFYWVDTTIIPFLNEDGKPESYVAIRTDITEQKKNEIELLRAKEEAESALIAKGEFLASMSHEIRTPMNGVIGMLGLLKHTKLDDKQTHQLSLAESSAHSLLVLINDILDFSKIEAGKLELENLEFNLRDELGEFSEAIGYKAQEKGIELILDVKEIEHQLVICDPGRLRQILNNLVGNSIKFTHDGEIYVKASLREINDNKAMLYISIKDSGIGIPSDKLKYLFDSFTQVDSSTTRKYGGTGLGLSIVKRLTKLMGGEVNVESIEGEGSTFKFNIEVTLPKEIHLVIPSVDIKGKRVLIVDDNKLNREVLSGQLLHWGMKVYEAEDANIALDICKQELLDGFLPPFDIALVDMQMPDIDGAQFGKKLKATPAYEDIKLVMMTSLGSREDALQFKEIGFSAFFPKPTTTKDLFYALNVLIEDDKALKESDNFITKDNLHAMEITTSWPKELNILLVEDNITNQIVANGILETLGLEADTVVNGKEALTTLKEATQKPYTVVLMDCQMPILDGYGASEAIRKGLAGDNNKNVVIIAMTANAMKGDKEKCLSSGMDDYLSKPINPDKLKAILRKWIRPNQED